MIDEQVTGSVFLTCPHPVVSRSPNNWFICFTITQTCLISLKSHGETIQTCFSPPTAVFNIAIPALSFSLSGSHGNPNTP